MDFTPSNPFSFDKISKMRKKIPGVKPGKTKSGTKIARLYAIKHYVIYPEFRIVVGGNRNGCHRLADDIPTEISI